MIRSTGGDAVFADGDVADAAVVKTMVGTAISQYGRLDCAFNNAGITHPLDHAWDEGAFRRTLDVNLTGILLCLKEEIPYMLKQGGGTIVNTSSISGILGSGAPSLPAYTASKHAVIGLTKTAALTYAKQNIRVNALLPGVTRTPILDVTMALGPEVKALLENFAPMGRMATAEEIAEVAIWLCSHKSSFVTGHSLVADGGYSIQ